MLKGSNNFLFDFEGTVEGEGREGRKSLEYFPPYLEGFFKLLLLHGSVKLSDKICKNERFCK